METIIISEKIAQKLKEKHQVERCEIVECFLNMDPDADYLEDSREQHRTDPPTKWFISKTNHNRELKVVFVPEGGKIFVKSAFPPNERERMIFASHAF